MGIVAVIMLFGMLNIEKLLPGFGEKAILLLTSGALMLIVWILGYIDLLFCRLIFSKDYPYWGRLFYQTVISQVFFAICFLPMVLIYANTETNGDTVYSITGVYIVLMLIVYKIWQIVYSTNEVKNISLYGVIGAFAVLCVSYIVDPYLFTEYPQRTMSVILAVWFLAECLITTILSLVYFGLNNFFDLHFWHFLPVKEQAKKEEVTVPPLES